MGDRKTNIDWIIHNEKKKYIQYSDREDKINEIKEKIENQRKTAKNDIENILENYKSKGSLPKCDRITVVADCEYMGEKIPFCSEPKKTNEEKSSDETSKTKKKTNYKTSFPNVFKIEIKNLIIKNFLISYRSFPHGIRTLFGLLISLSKKMKK